MLAISAIILLLSVLASGNLQGRMTKVFALFVTCIYSCLTITYLVVDQFTGEGFNEAFLYHVLFGLEGAGFGANMPVVALATGLLLAGILFTWVHSLYLRSPKKRIVEPGIFRPRNLVYFSLLVCAFLVNPGVHSLSRLSYDSLIRSSFPGGLDSSGWENRFKELYAVPRQPVFRPGQPNLVLIYLESIEANFFDPELFPGLLPLTSDALRPGVEFSDIRQLPGTGWTIAGMVASQCGLPLVTSSSQNSMEHAPAIYPGAVCIGDLLSGMGYQLTFMQGSSLEFSGIGKFYRGHGFDTIMGRDEFRLSRMTRDDESEWGLTDEVLFDHAWGEFERLADQGDPFGLFIATIDSHYDGHEVDKCSGVRYEEMDEKIGHVIRCLDRSIARFLMKLQDFDSKDDVLVVVLSDHLAMTNSVMEHLESRPRKLAFFILGSSERPALIETPGSMLDVAPTILDLMGHEPQLGLGRSLVNAGPDTRAIFPEVERNLRNWRTSIMDFWLFPSWHDGIQLNTWTESLAIKERQLSIPMLLRINPDGSTIPYFDGEGMSELIGHMLSFEPEEMFLLVHYCDWLNEFEGIQDETARWCVLTGKLGSEIDVTPVHFTRTWDRRQLEALLERPSRVEQASRNTRALKALHAKASFY